MKTATTMWADMLGLGPLLAQVNDPAFQAELRGFVASQIETRDRVRRCEAYLIAIADRLGIEHGGIGRSAVIPADLGTVDPGRAAPASGFVDDGAGGTTAAPGPARRYLHSAGD